MNILIRQATILDPASPFHRQQADILVQQGVITAIGPQLSAGEPLQIVEALGLMACPGWVDIFANLADPGFEYKETLESGAAAAAAGGYTDVFALPNTAPFVHSKAAVEYVVHKSRHLPVAIHPIGGVTKNGEGKELAEMYDMRSSGAIAFGDGLSTVQSAGVLLKALQYLKAINGVLVQVPDDKSVSAHGLMNESVVSTRLGLAGNPAIAEELMIQRDLELARYTESKIHFTGVSTARGIALIQRAKEEGIAASCSVTPHHLFFCEDDLQEYDTNLKVSPPLRSKADRDALRQALIGGAIDCIASHHQPHEKDSKVVEFEYARSGMTALETTFAAVRTAVPQLSEVRLAELFGTAPRRLFGLPQAGISKGQPACITLFNPNASWQVRKSDFRSLSRNTAFDGMTLTGKAYGIINKDHLFLNAE